MTFTTLFIRDAEGGYAVRVPALRGCVTQGDTLAEAIDMARDAMQLYIECLTDDGEPVPEDTRTIELYDHEVEVLVLKLSVTPTT